MSTITNENYAQLVQGTKYADTISNNAFRVTISADAGDDDIWNGSSYKKSGSEYLWHSVGHFASINGGAGNDTISNYSSDSTLRGGNGNDSIVNSGYPYIDNHGIYTGIGVLIDGGKGNDTLENNGANSTILGGAGNDSIRNYSRFDNKGDFGKSMLINGGTGNDTIWNSDLSSNCTFLGGAGNDHIENNASNVTIAGGAGNDTITLAADASSNVINYTSGDGNDKIYGFNGSSVLRIGDGKGTYSTTESGDNIIVTVGKGKITIVGGADVDELHIDGALVSNVAKSTTAKVTADPEIKFITAAKRTTAINITGNKLANSIVGGNGADILSGGYGADTLSGGKGNDSLSGGKGSDKLLGGDGADTLAGGTGNDTLTGGKGADVFVYSGGKDIITDYATGDKISVGGAISKATVSGKNVVFTVGTGSLTVKNGKNKKLALTDSTGQSYTAVVSASNAMKVTLTDTYTSPATLDAGIKTVDASSRKKALNLTGNALANSIKGGSGNDTLTGGKGNDSLWGNGGNDTFIYSSGDGKDVIYGFGNNDLLQITGGTVTASYNSSKKEVAFKVGSTSDAITLKSFGTTTTFHVNSTTYQLSGGKLTQK